MRNTYIHVLNLGYKIYLLHCSYSAALSHKYPGFLVLSRQLIFPVSNPELGVNIAKINGTNSFLSQGKEHAVAAERDYCGTVNLGEICFA